MAQCPLQVVIMANKKSRSTVKKKFAEKKSTREYSLDTHSVLLLGISFLVILAGTFYLLSSVFGLEFEKPFPDALSYLPLTYSAECLPQNDATAKSTSMPSCCLVNDGTTCTTENGASGKYVRCDNYNKPVNKNADGTCK